jgi:hypothetical protein
MDRTRRKNLGASTITGPPAELPDKGFAVSRSSARGLPILATVEDAEDVDHELIGRLIHLVCDEGRLLEGARPQARSDVVAPSAGEREHQDAVDVVEDRRHEASSDLSRRHFGDPVVEFVELLRCFGGLVDLARHERAAHLLSSRARTSSGGIVRDGSAFSES